MGMSSPRLNRCSSESVCRAPACPPCPWPAFPCDKYSFPIFFASFLLPAPAPMSRRTVSPARPPRETLAVPRATPKGPARQRRTECPSRTGGNAVPVLPGTRPGCPAPPCRGYCLRCWYKVLVHGEHVVQRLTADMTCLLLPTAANSQSPPPTHGPFCSSRDIGLPINGRIAWPLPALALALALAMAAFCFLPFAGAAPPQRARLQSTT
ncbi:uncharacterized protein TrAtP1_012493 [Trichoderma atroviride]|uniref:uncharacterized protein n=1 Tax=Hypocrea atroviridis TaxID=63577 RepID=UPI00332B0ED8|nr:hypothetical protein TrAtP1_012493 [Trichoderma atroviride]